MNIFLRELLLPEIPSILVGGGVGVGWWRVTANGDDGNVLKLDCGDGCTTLSVPLGCMPVTADFMVCK